MDTTTVKNVKNRKKGKKSKKNATRRKLKYMESLGGATLPPVVPPRTYLKQQQQQQETKQPEFMEQQPILESVEQPVKSPSVVEDPTPLSPEQPVGQSVVQSSSDDQPELLSPEQPELLSTDESVGEQTSMVAQPELQPADESAAQPELQPADQSAAQPELQQTDESAAQPELQQTDESVAQPELQQTDESVEEKPVIVEENKEDDPIKTALMEQLKQIEQQTAKIKSQLYPEAAGGGLNKVLKKRKKTFYKKYKSKISMKRRNKTSRNK